MDNKHVLLESQLDLPLVHRGKVRDIYDLGEQLLFVTTDRLSAFDVVFDQGIPGKGRVLTQMSQQWADQLATCRPFHCVTSDIDQMPKLVQAQKDILQGCVMLVERLEMFPVECVVRNYLVGSGWKDYQATGAVCGHILPKGLHNGEQLPEPIFTPATKAAVGDHDENISVAKVRDMIGADLCDALQKQSLEIFNSAASFAAQRGLILVDTKFEFGRRPDGTVVLADEILTPDSSRYWDAEEAQATKAGATPPSFDKQIVRDHVAALDWNKKAPAPTLPEQIINRTAERYAELSNRLFGDAMGTD